MAPVVASSQQIMYRIDPARSTIGFSVKNMIFRTVHGRFATFSGTIAVDPTDPTRSSVEVAVDAASIDTGIAKRDEHLRSADFLDVAKVQAITFASTAVEAFSPTQLRITGDLTIHGMTRRVVLEAHTDLPPTGDREVARYTARTTIDRREFGITHGPSVMIGYPIAIDLAVQAVRQPRAG